MNDLSKRFSVFGAIVIAYVIIDHIGGIVLDAKISSSDTINFVLSVLVGILVGSWSQYQYNDADEDADEDTARWPTSSIAVAAIITVVVAFAYIKGYINSNHNLALIGAVGGFFIGNSLGAGFRNFGSVLMGIIVVFYFVYFAGFIDEKDIIGFIRSVDKLL